MDYNIRRFKLIVQGHTAWDLNSGLYDSKINDLKHLEILFLLALVLVHLNSL